jgi:hypothetical protein
MCVMIGELGYLPMLFGVSDIALKYLLGPCTEGRGSVASSRSAPRSSGSQCVAASAPLRGDSARRCGAMIVGFAVALGASAIRAKPAGRGIEASR